MAFGLKSNTCLKCFKSLNIKCYQYLSYSSANIGNKVKDMPKDNSLLVQKLRENRIKSAKKTANNKLASNQFQLCVLGNGSKGNPRALYVCTDRNSYLFNCGEGTQRLANEHKLKLSKLENIFITRRCSENMSGLVGLALTCQDIGVPQLTLHGPQHIDQVLSLYKYFLTFSGMKIQNNSYVGYKFEDLDLVVNCFPIFSNEDNIQTIKKLKIEQNRGIDSKEMAFLYLCKLKTRPGELLINKCIELKVPAGPLLGQLKAGHDVVLSDNRVIHSKDVMGPEDRGPIFIVLECPSISAIDSLVTNEQIFQHLLKDLELLSVIVHFSPTHVMQDKRYREWMKRLGDSVEHIVLNEDNPRPSLISANRLQIHLNLIDSFVFPLLHCLKTEEIKQKSDSNRTINANTLSKYHLRPTTIKGLDSESIVGIDVNGFRETVISNKQFMESLNRFHSLQSDVKTQDFPEIIFLGTGSAVPSKVRNTSAIWVNLDSETSFLMDCGEGTVGQLYRFYGEEYESRLKQLKGIYVSHLHADHHLGMLQIIKNRSLLTAERLVLITPPAVKNWLQKYNETIERISHLYEIVLCAKFRTETDERVLKTLRLNEIKTVLVPHCSHSYGIAFITKTDPNYKIVYSGDTQPSDTLTQIGQNCDLLIHEASMEDQLVAEARLKFHSTTSEAIEMGNNMNAKFTLLTHFSQRYAKIPVFNEKFGERIGIAFDNMRVRMSDLHKLPKMIPTLECLFVQQIEEMRAKTAHLLKRKQLLDEYYTKEVKNN